MNIRIVLGFFIPPVSEPINHMNSRLYKLSNISKNSVFHVEFNTEFLSDFISQKQSMQLLQSIVVIQAGFFSQTGHTNGGFNIRWLKLSS